MQSQREQAEMRAGSRRSAKSAVHQEGGHPYSADWLAERHRQREADGRRGRLARGEQALLSHRQKDAPRQQEPQAELNRLRAEAIPR